MTPDPDSHNTPTRIVTGGEPRSDTTAGFETQPSAVSSWFGPPVADGEVGVLGPYRVMREVGRGGMGAVYEAVDTRLGRTVALKVVLPQFAGWRTARERFVREGRMTAGVLHDNVVTVYEADERDGVAYIAMQFLHGEPLNEQLKKNPSPSAEVLLRVARDVADGLAAAHRVGLVHRDIKPANLWVEPSGRVKVLDFGTAKPLDVDAELTGSGVIVGTPAYMAPEQARGEKVDGRADLFSLGAVLYRLSTGRLPFPGTNPLAVLSALASDQPTPIRELNPDVPPPLAELIRRMMAKNPDDRPATAEQVADLVRVIERGEDPFGRGAQPSTEPRRAARKPPRWWPWAVGLGLVALAAAVAGVVVVITHKDGSQTRLEVPSGATVTIQTDEKPKPPPAPPTDREAAEFVSKLGGQVFVNGSRDPRPAKAGLPDGDFALTGVGLAGKAITDDRLAVFRGCRSLNYIDLDNTTAGDAGLKHFAGLPGLTHLFLGETKVTDAGLEHIKESKKLRHLYVQGTGVTDAGLKHLAGITTLVAVNVGMTQVTDAGLEHLKGCRGMQELHLYNTGISDAGVKYFAGCEGLILLGLNYTKVTDAALEPAAGWKKLQTVSLYGTGVTDTGLGHLKGCAGLKKLDVRQTRVTADGVAAFHAAVPGCEVTYDGGVLKAKK